VWFNTDALLDDPQQVPLPLKAKYRESVIIVVKVEDHHSPYESARRDGVVIVNNSQPFTVILKDLRFGKMLRIKATANCSEQNPVSIYPPHGRTIDGEEVLTLTQPYSSVILVSDETGWLIF